MRNAYIIPLAALCCALLPHAEISACAASCSKPTPISLVSASQAKQKAAAAGGYISLHGAWPQSHVSLAAVSKKKPFTKGDSYVTYSAKDRAKKVKQHPPMVSLHDQWGNELGRVDGQKLSARDATRMFASSADQSARRRAACARAVAAARKAMEKDRLTASTIKNLAQFSKDTGYDECQEVDSLMQDILSAGRESLAAAKHQMSDDERGAKSALRSLARTFAGTAVADEAKALL